MRILLVEDYGPLRLSIAERLREAGYIVDHTADGREGLWFAKENHYSLAILDLKGIASDCAEISAVFSLEGTAGASNRVSEGSSV